MHCAESGDIIAYEPDAVVCPSVSSSSHKSSTPDECPCGADLASLRPKAAAKDAT